VTTPRRPLTLYVCDNVGCRGWVINPMDVTHWWLIPLAIVPAMLGMILIFLDQQITSVIVNRKEHKLQVTVNCYKLNYGRPCHQSEMLSVKYSEN